MRIKSYKYSVAGRHKERVNASNEVRVKQSYQASLVLLLSASHLIRLLHSFVVTYDNDPQLFVCEHLAEPLGHNQYRRAAAHRLWEDGGDALGKHVFLVLFLIQISLILQAFTRLSAFKKKYQKLN